MPTDQDAEQQYVPQKKKMSTEEENRRKKIVPGSLMKAVIRPGSGDSAPSDGDQVIYHCTVRTLEGVVVESTKSEFGGKGIPIRQIMGKSKMILGLLEGIPTMSKEEVAMFKMKPQMHYGETDCPVSVSKSFPKEDELHFEIEMIDFFKVKVISNDDMGVIKRVLEDGQGWESPREPYEVKAWISAKSVDGKILKPRAEEPYFFTFGKSEAPKGLEMGIGTMSRKEKAVIYVTNKYLTPSPFITEFGTIEEVHFEVELEHFIQVRDMLGDGRLIKRRIRDGEGEFPMDCPLHDSLLRVHYRGMLLSEEKTIFYDTRIDNDGQPLEFGSGEGLVPEGFEMCVRLMLPGELAVVTCPPDYAYDKFPRPSNVPEGSHVQWEIELLGFETPKDWTGLDLRSIMDEADKIKFTGNRLFKEGKFELAKAKYEKVLREFNHVHPQDDEEGKKFSNARNLLHLNVAACFLKMGECKKCIEACNKMTAPTQVTGLQHYQLVSWQLVLDANPAHVKGLYRRGMAHMAAGDFEDARDDFQKMIAVEKACEADATAALFKLKQKEQEAEKKARKQFKGLFDKKPGEIADVAYDKDKSTSVIKSERSKDILSDKDETEGLLPAEADMPRMGLFSRFWPSGRRLFTKIGIDRCIIL